MATSSMYPGLDGVELVIPVTAGILERSLRIRYLATGYLMGTSHNVVLEGTTYTNVQINASKKITADQSRQAETIVRAAIADGVFHEQETADSPKCCDVGVARFIVDVDRLLFATPKNIPALVQLFLEIDPTLTRNPGGLPDNLTPEPLPFPLPSPDPDMPHPLLPQIMPDGAPPPTFASHRKPLRSAYGGLSGSDDDNENKTGVKYALTRVLKGCKLLGSKLVHGDYSLRQRFFEQKKTVSELLNIGYSLKQMKDQLQLETVQHLCGAGLHVEDMKRSRWTALLTHFDLKRIDLPRSFALTHFKEFLVAGLSAPQLAILGINANSLLAEKRLFKDDLKLAYRRGWRFLRREWMDDEAWIYKNDWARFGLDYNTLLGLHMQREDYKTLLRVHPTCIAIMLGLTDNTAETMAKLERIGLHVPADFLCDPHA